MSQEAKPAEFSAARSAGLEGGEAVLRFCVLCITVYLNREFGDEKTYKLLFQVQSTHFTNVEIKEREVKQPGLTE